MSELNNENKSQYKVLEAIEVEGTTYEAGASLALTDDQAAANEGKVEKVEAGS